MIPRTLPWVFSALLIAQVVNAQIPNAGFETWSNGNPVGWTTNNSPPTVVPVTQALSGHSGSAAQGSVVSIVGFPFAPLLLSDTNGTGRFPYVGRPGALHGFYKFSPVGGDQYIVTSVLSKTDTAFAAGSFITRNATSSIYTEFVANFFYSLPGNCDSATIEVTIGGDSLTFMTHIGSTFLLDDLSFGAATGVEETEHPQSFKLEQNYPNPFNPSTNIRFQIPTAGFVSLKVYNLLGQEVATLVNEELPPGGYKATFNGSAFPTGTYLYTLRTGTYSETKKFVLVK